MKRVAHRPIRGSAGQLLSGISQSSAPYYSHSHKVIIWLPDENQIVLKVFPRGKLACHSLAGPGRLAAWHLRGGRWLPAAPFPFGQYWSAEKTHLRRHQPHPTSERMPLHLCCRWTSGRSLQRSLALEWALQAPLLGWCLVSCNGRRGPACFSAWRLSGRLLWRGCHLGDWY